MLHHGKVVLTEQHVAMENLVRNVEAARRRLCAVFTQSNVDQQPGCEQELARRGLRACRGSRAPEAALMFFKSHITVASHLPSQGFGTRLGQRSEHDSRKEQRRGKGLRG